MGEEGDLVAPRLARGCRCFAAWIGDEVAGYGWLSTDREWIGELQLTISPRPGEGYIWNCVTLPEHRRKGIFRAMIGGISEIAQSEGLRRLWIGSVAIPAEHAMGPAGFIPTLHFSSVTFQEYHWLRVTPSDDLVLAQDACEVLRIRPGAFLRIAHQRRH